MCIKRQANPNIQMELQGIVNSYTNLEKEK